MEKYNIKELQKNNSGYVCHIKNEEEHKALIKKKFKISNYNPIYKYYLLPNEGISKEKRMYECDNYKIIEFEQIILENSIIYEIY